MKDNQYDDDGNGYIDDRLGWNFIGENNNLDDDHGHGTAVAGTIAAGGNNGWGIAGLAYNCKILPLSVIDSGGHVTTFDKVARALTYAARYADVINCSFGGTIQSSAENQAIDYAVTKGRNGKGCPLFAGSGNWGSDWDNYRSRYRVSLADVPSHPASGQYRIEFLYTHGPNTPAAETLSTRE